MMPSRRFSSCMAGTASRTASRITCEVLREKPLSVGLRDFQPEALVVDDTGKRLLVLSDVDPARTGRYQALVVIDLKTRLPLRRGGRVRLFIILYKRVLPRRRGRRRFRSARRSKWRRALLAAAGLGVLCLGAPVSADIT